MCSNFGKYALFLILIIISLLHIFWTYISVTFHVLSDKHTVEIQYFLEDFNRLQKNIPSLLINSTCNIPNLDVWDPPVEIALSTNDHSKDPECWRNGKNYWTHIDHLTDELVVNIDIITRDGYTWENLICTYKVIKRISENETELSAEKPVLAIKTRMRDEFFMVQCRAKVGPVAPILYKMYHTVATLQKDDPYQHDRIRKKRERWKNIGSGVKRPPSILILGQDATSRLNFKRFMNKTISILNELGAVEMLGYSALGYGTRGNLIPVLTGYSESQMWEVCLEKEAPFYDNCPMIWRQLDDAGYLTAHLEDSYAGGIYQGDAIGFNKLMVDFYNRPLIHKARGESILSDLEFMNRCIQHQTSNEFLLNHIDAIVTKAHQEDIPFAVFSHSTAMTHDYNGALKHIDAPLAGYLQNWINNGIMNNTILIILGDHGIRWGTFRENVLQGQYEVNLPVLWITLPTWMQEGDDDEWQTFKQNRYSLSSHYSLYWTLQYWLKKWSDKTYKTPENAKYLSSSTTISRRYTQDFMHPIPTTFTCHDFGINQFYCPCQKPNSTVLVPSDPQVIAAAKIVLDHINNQLIDVEKCRKLEIRRIKKAIATDSGGSRRIQMDLVTMPGDGLYDASASISSTDGQVEIVRINQIQKEYTKCTRDGRLELYCYCK